MERGRLKQRRGWRKDRVEDRDHRRRFKYVYHRDTIRECGGNTHLKSCDGNTCPSPVKYTAI